MKRRIRLLALWVILKRWNDTETAQTPVPPNLAGRKPATFERVNVHFVLSLSRRLTNTCVESMETSVCHGGFSVHGSLAAD